MLRKNLMEDKQLKFNQPLLSVRRNSPAMISQRDEKKKTDNSFPTMTHPPHYKSEVKSDLVGNPGAVPFLWEHSPGRPKDETRPRTCLTEKPPTAPKLPPGWKLKDNQDSDKEVESVKSQRGKVQNAMPSCTSVGENVKKIDSFDKSNETTQDKENIESEDGDEAYLDALDTLSRTESSFRNCSVSGLSGFNEPDAKPSVTSLTDPRTKDFMMSRFLPAAKAMASENTSETPHYVRRKQPPVQEQPRQLKKVINGDTRPQLRYGPSFTLYHSQVHDNEEEESDDDCYDNGNLSTKVCGLLPHFCLKSSFRLINPVPGMSVRGRIPISPASRTRTGSSSTASCSGTENEQSTFDASEQKSLVGSLITQPHKDKNDAKASANSTNANDPYDNKAIRDSTAEVNNPEVRYLGLQKNTLRRFQELLSNESNSREVDLLTPVVEKTLYVDIVHKMDSSAKVSCSPDKESSSNLQDADIEILKEIIKQKSLIDSSIDSSEKLADDRASLKPYLQREVELSPPHAVEKLNKGRETKTLNVTSHAQDCYQDAMTLAKPDSDAGEKTRKPTLRRGKAENSCKVHPEFLVPPPLPKSPSDSWLCRTLPSLSTKNASSQSYIGTGINPNNQSSKPLPVDPKWETIVKMTKQQHHL